MLPGRDVMLAIDCYMCSMAIKLTHNLKKKMVKKMSAVAIAARGLIELVKVQLAHGSYSNQRKD